MPVFGGPEARAPQRTTPDKPLSNPTLKLDAGGQLRQDYAQAACSFAFQR
jgi:hypothetical protein